LCDTRQSCDKFINKHKKNTYVIRVKDGLWIIEGKIEENHIKITSPIVLAILKYTYTKEYIYKTFYLKSNLHMDWIQIVYYLKLKI